jgi:uncharacterized membrane protein YeaQ/YmgE (transglycosylase-associated protein family)
MGLLGIIVFGAVVGLVADLIDRAHDNRWYVDVVLGIVGAVVGGLLRQLFTSNNTGATGALHWDVWSFLWALGGTLVVLWAYHRFNRRRVA